MVGALYNVEGAALEKVVPLEVRMLPLLPGAMKVTLLVPAPTNRLLAVSVPNPVPPWATVCTPVTCVLGRERELRVVRVLFDVAVMFDAVPEVFWLSVGKSAATAIVRAPVVVVDLRMPVPKAEVPAL